MKGRGLHVYALCYLLFLYAPILLLPIFAFNNGTVISFPLKGFTTHWFVQAFENQPSEESCSFSQKDLLSGLQMWADKAGQTLNS